MVNTVILSFKNMVIISVINYPTETVMPWYKNLNLIMMHHLH